MATILDHSAYPSDVKRHIIHILYINNDQDYLSDLRGADRPRALAMAVALVVTSTMSIAVQATVVDRYPQQSSAIPAYTHNAMKSARFT
jgi:hypothetical protein